MTDNLQKTRQLKQEIACLIKHVNSYSVVKGAITSTLCELIYYTNPNKDECIKEIQYISNDMLKAIDLAYDPNHSGDVVMINE